MKEFRKIQTIEVIKRVVKGEPIENQLPGQVAEYDGYLVQNKGQDSDRWVVPTEVFYSSYEPVKRITDGPSLRVAPGPTTFLERLQVECKELVGRKVKLQAFFATPTFPDLSRDKKTLLYRQERLMSELIEVLGYRIELEGSKYKVSDDAVAVDKDGNELK